MAREYTGEVVPVREYTGEIIPIQQEPEPRSFGGELAHQAGLTARAGLTGLATVPQILGGAMEALGVRGAGSNVGATLSDILGLPKPQTDIERMSQAGASAMAGGFPIMKAGQMVASAPQLTSLAQTTGQRIGEVLASQPAAQLALGGIGGAAGEAAKIGGAGELGQLAASVAVPMAVAPLAAGGAAVARSAKNVVAPLVSEEAAQRGAAKLAIRATGERAEQAAQALASSTGKETAGQVAAAIENADLAALQSIVNKTDETFAGAIKKGIKQKIKQGKEDLENRLAPQRNYALNLAAEGGVDPTPILNRITSMANAKGNLSDEVVQKSLSTIRGKIEDVMTDGTIDPNELYTIRKKITSVIKQFSKESSSWDKKKTATLERELQLSMDKAIDSAISRAAPDKTGLWSDAYMKEYAKGASKIRAIEESLDKQKELARLGMSAVSKTLGKEENQIAKANLLNRAVQIFNTIARAAEGAAGERVERQLKTMMAPEAYGGDPRLLGRLMQRELEREPTFLESLMAGQPVTRGALGYVAQEPVIEATPRRIQIDKDIPYKGLPELNIPLVPGSERIPPQPTESLVHRAFRSESPLPVFAEDLLPVADRYRGTNIPIGRVEGGLFEQKTPLPELPPIERGLLSLEEPQATIFRQQGQPEWQKPLGVDFQLKQEVLQRPEIVAPTQAFLGEAIRLRGLIESSSGFWKTRYRDELTALEKKFGDGMRQLGVDNAIDALGLKRLYEYGVKTKLPIEKTRGMLEAD